MTYLISKYTKVFLSSAQSWLDQIWLLLINPLTNSWLGNVAVKWHYAPVGRGPTQWSHLLLQNTHHGSSQAVGASLEGAEQIEVAAKLNEFSIRK